jgi:putative membrane protein
MGRAPGVAPFLESSRILEEVTMERMKKNDVWMSKARGIALAVFTLTAGVAGRALADSTATTGPIDDARIVSRVLAMNRAEERTARSVKAKLGSVAVWQLADRIQSDYADLDRQFLPLAPGGGESIEDRIVDAKEPADLSNLSGAALDKAYVEREVETHSAMLASLDRELIPNANDPALRQRLADLRTDLAAQLQQAQNVQRAEWFLRTAEQERADISKEISNDGP